MRSRLVCLPFSGRGNVAVHTLISPQNKKNRTRPIRERRGRRQEIRNPIQARRAPFHCKCGRGHSQFQKEQVSYIRVWRDGGPSCSPSCEAHARAAPPVINTDLLEIPAEPQHCHRRPLGEGGRGVLSINSDACTSLDCCDSRLLDGDGRVELLASLANRAPGGCCISHGAVLPGCSWLLFIHLCAAVCCGTALISSSWPLGGFTDLLFFVS